MTDLGANWLWAWSLAIPKSSKHLEAAQKFIRWATSKEYIALVGKESSWNNVPTGTRKSTYANLEFQKVTQFAAAEQKAIYSADPNNNKLQKAAKISVRRLSSSQPFQSFRQLVQLSGNKRAQHCWAR